MRRSRARAGWGCNADFAQQLIDKNDDVGSIYGGAEHSNRGFAPPFFLMLSDQVRPE